jgi:hypothetical protein
VADKTESALTVATTMNRTTDYVRAVIGGNSRLITPANILTSGATHASVKKSVDQTGANFTVAAAPIVWDTEIADVGGWHNFTATVTVTIASPGVVTWNSHGLSNGNAVVLTTTGALPTGLTAGTTYYVVSAAANTFQLAATVGGAAINTSGSQSGTHTGTNNSILRVPAGVALVQFGCNLRMANLATTDAVTLLLAKNGTSVFDGAGGYVGVPANATPRLSITSGLVSVSAGDNLEVLIAVSADTSADITASVSNFWARAVG